MALPPPRHVFRFPQDEPSPAEEHHDPAEALKAGHEAVEGPGDQQLQQIADPGDDERRGQDPRFFQREGPPQDQRDPADQDGKLEGEEGRPIGNDLHRIRTVPYRGGKLRIASGGGVKQIEIVDQRAAFQM